METEPILREHPEKRQHVLTLPVRPVLGPSSSGTPQSGSAIEIEIADTGEIASVRPTGKPSSLFVTPGLVNTHVHWLMLGDASPMAAFEMLQKDPARLLEKAKESARKAVACGITTALDKAPPGSHGARTGELYQALVAARRNGEPVPRMHYASLTLAAPGGAFDEMSRIISTRDDVDRALDEMQDYGSTWAKVVPENEPEGSFDYRCTLPGDLFSHLSRQCKRRGLRLAVHAKGHGMLLECLKLDVHSVEHGLQMSANLARAFDEQGTHVGLTLEGLWGRLQAALHANSGQTRASESSWKLAVAAYEWGAGLRVAQLMRNLLQAPEGTPARIFRHLSFASDAGSCNTPHGSLAELYWLRRVGFRPEEIFQVATRGGADALGESHRLGKIAPGFLADLVFWSKNPLDLDVEEWKSLESHIAAVVINGEIVFRRA